MWGDGRVEPLPITLDRNLLVCNYHCVVPIDNDDGSNGYVISNNFLLWGGTKSLMGYNKVFANNTFVYVDFTPVVYARDHLGLRLGPSSPPSSSSSSPLEFETKFGVCATEIASAPFAASGLQDQWFLNTCIANSSSRFFQWMSCNSSDLLGGTIPVPMQGNTYMSFDGGYEMSCGSTKWTALSEVQAQGVDVGSTNSTLPSDQDLVALAHEVLQF
jgi:hypothetical protein